MSVTRKYQAYAQATQTVAKTRQIVLLYDGAIRYVQQAKEAIREKRIEDRYNLLIKAADIISGLQGCLDFEKGGDIARVLFQYYASVEARMFSVHHTNSLESCNEIVDDLKQMRDVWAEIDRNATSGDQPAAAKSEAPSNGASPPPENPAGVILSA